MALLLIAPVWVIPALAPAAALLAVTLMLPPPAFRVMAPKVTMVDDAPPLAFTVKLLAVTSPGK